MSRSTRRFTPATATKIARPTSVGSAFYGKKVAWAIDTPDGKTLDGLWIWGDSPLSLKNTIERAAQVAGFEHHFVFNYGVFVDMETGEFIEV